MTASRFLPCRCGHPKSEHEALAPQCAAGHCTCLRYLPVGAPGAAVPRPTSMLASVPPATPTPVRGPVEPGGPTIEQVITAGKRSSSKRISALAKKVEVLAGDLRTRLAEERVAADEARRKAAATEEARREIIELEAKLAAARAKLRPAGRTPPATSANTGDGVCPDCGKTGLKSIGPHRSRAHGYRAGEAS